MIIIEGPRNVGKSFLLRNYKVEKFNSLPYIENKPESFNWGFTLGKDLMLNYLIKYLPNNIIFDRGFLSTAVYARIFNRAPPLEIENYLNNYINTNINIIYIKGKNPNKARTKDSMDYLAYEKQEEVYDEYIKKFPHICFINKFNKESEKEFKELLDEHFGL